MLRDQMVEHRRERERAEAREDALRAEMGRLANRVAEAEAAAVEGWRTAADLAQCLAAPRPPGPTPTVADLAHLIHQQGMIHSKT